MSADKSKALPRTIARVLMVALALLAGFGMMRLLIALKVEPRQLDPGEPRKVVQAIMPQREEVPVVITGYGEAKALDVVRISAEVMGQIVDIHPRLEVGEIIPEGELLFRIDPRDYVAAAEQAEAQVSQMTDTATRLKRQYAIDQERLETLRRSRELAQQEFDRIRQLYEKDEVGTLSGVDKSEMAFNQSDDAYDQLSQAVELYPLRIREAESGQASAKAQLDMAQTHLARTEVRAPFTGRLKEVNLEKGQYVAPGTPVLTLANDAVLELRVPLDSRDARRWLRFSTGQTEGTSWFAAPEPVTCRVRWSEEPADHEWQGTLDRVVNFDEDTRTVTVAVRVTGAQARSKDDAMLPLVDGMFCSVEIPGETMQGVFRLPRWAVTFEDEVFVAEEGVEMVAIEAPRGSAERAEIAEALAAVREQAQSVEPDDNTYIQAAERGLSIEQRHLWHGFEEVAEQHVPAAEASGGLPDVSQWVPRTQLDPSLAAVAFEKSEPGETGIIENDQGFYMLRPQERLQVRKVEVLRTQGEETIVGDGLEEGDVVVVTRLVDPLPGSLLTVELLDGMEGLS